MLIIWLKYIVWSKICARCANVKERSLVIGEKLKEQSLVICHWSLGRRFGVMILHGCGGNGEMGRWGGGYMDAWMHGYMVAGLYSSRYGTTGKNRNLNIPVPKLVCKSVLLITQNPMNPPPHSPISPSPPLNDISNTRKTMQNKSCVNFQFLIMKRGGQNEKI
jgi:hypothetical protein